MRRITLCAVLALLVYMTAAAQDKQVQLKIALKHDNDVGEAQTKSQLQRLLTQYDCSKFVFTKDVALIVMRFHTVIQG